MPDLITTDIDNFWRAFDAADRLPTPDRVRLFKSAYYDVASLGMRDFVAARVNDVEQFERVVTFHDAFYRSVRVSMLRIREFEKRNPSFLQAISEAVSAARDPHGDVCRRSAIVLWDHVPQWDADRGGAVWKDRAHTDGDARLSGAFGHPADIRDLRDCYPRAGSHTAQTTRYNGPPTVGQSSPGRDGRSCDRAGYAP